jgi:2-polyprenyl-6-methoxyphenol hydroxylase-like FAD-dependent oxidoreductase
MMGVMLVPTQYATYDSDKTGATDFDVVVIGARCAGAATAMLLAARGHDVLVVDRAEFPSDTLSTHAISRGGIVALDRWGLLDEVISSGAPQIRKVSFHPPEGEPTHRVVKDHAGVDFVLAPRRYVLDEIVLDGARRAGASIDTGVSATGVMRDDDGRVGGVHLRDRRGNERAIRSRFVVGADGVRSRIARSVGARIIDQRPAEGATYYTYASGLATEGAELHPGTRGSAGVIETHNGESNVWVCVPADRALSPTESRGAAFLGLLAEVAPALAARVHDAEITAPVRGALRLPNHVVEAAGPGWALAGDAAYHRDPVTGHGITDAFRDAELLATHLGAVLRGETSEAAGMACYSNERLRALRPIFELTCKLAEYPPLDEFLALHRELSLLIELEAEWFVSRPPIPRRDCVTA